jgi:hypothetical protein
MNAYDLRERAEVVLRSICGYGVPRSAKAVIEELGWPMEMVYQLLVWLEARGYATVRCFHATNGQRMGWLGLVDRLPNKEFTEVPRKAWHEMDEER